MSPWDFLSCGDIPIPLGKKYFTSSDLHYGISRHLFWHTFCQSSYKSTLSQKKQCMVCYDSMLWFLSEPTRNRKWLASHCHCPAATSGSDADRSAMHHFGQGMSECPLRAGTGPPVPTECWRLQLGLAVIWWPQLGRSSAHRNLALTVEVRSAE
jgi:hypothetical protein